MKTIKKKHTKDCLTCGYFIVDNDGEPHIDMYVDGIQGIAFNQAVCSSVLLKSYCATKELIEEKTGKLSDNLKKEILEAYEDMTKALIKYIKKDLYERD